MAHQHLGDALAQVDGPPTALESYQRARAFRAELVAEFPDNADYRRLLSSTDYWIGYVFQDMGRYRDALLRYRSGLSLDSGEVARDPRNAAYRRAADLMRGTSLDPTNAGYRGYLAGAFSDLAAVYDSLGGRVAPGERRRHRLAALELYRQSAAIWSDLDTRGLVNPTDTGRVRAVGEAVARAEAGLR